VASNGNFFLSERSTSPGQNRVAAAVVITVFVAFLLVIPFKDHQWPSLGGFIPIVDTMLLFADLLAAVLLYTQFTVLRTHAVLALAMGYLFTALIIVAHLLTFPGALAPAGLLGSNLQSAVWLYIIWHFGLPLSAIAYALLKRRNSIAWMNTRRAIVLSICTVVALAVGLTVAATVYADDLPSIMINVTQAKSIWSHVGAPAILLVCLTSIVLLWHERSSMLDTWVLVALWAWFIETILLTMTSSRFTLVWYAGRGVGLVSSSIVLLVLLYESTMAYARLGAAVAAHDREREGKRLSIEVTVGSIAHELRQPLTAIVANCEAGIQLLGRTPPDLQETRAALKEIETEGFHANDIIKSIQATFADAGRAEALIDMGQAIRETLALLRTELQFHETAVQLETAEDLPPIHGDKGQIVQVLVNLVMNAVDSMRDITSRPRILNIRAEAQGLAHVSVRVEDCGAGIRPELIGRIFDPFFTTKGSGTGLGLAICRTIVEAHSGRITVAPGTEHGSVFQILLPVR
jgi:signal transduction histidine kinase